MKRKTEGFTPSNFFLMSLFIILMLIFFTVRDTRLVSLIVRSGSSEFELIAQWCTDFPACFRLLPSLIGHFTIQVAFIVSEILSLNPDPFLSDPITINDRYAFLVALTSVLYRLVTFVIIVLIIKKGSGSLTIALCITNAFLVLMLAPQSQILKAITSVTNFSESEETWLYSMPQIYLIYYDYFSLLIVLLLAFRPNILLQRSYVGLILIGVLLFLSFEFLPIFAYFYLGFLKKSNLYGKAIMLLAGPFFVILAVFMNQLERRDSSIIDTFSYYAQSNISNFFGLIIIFLIVLTPPVILGHILGGVYFPAVEYRASIFSLNRLSLAASKSLLVIHILSFLTSGVTSEFGRQSIALQFTLLVVFYTRRIKKY